MDKYWSILLLLPLTVQVIAREDADRGGAQTPFITNGERAEEGQFPWQAALYAATDSRAVFCGGSLIADSWILTAAHCVHKMKRIIVLLGAHRLPDLTEDSRQAFLVNANDSHVHPEWNLSTLRNDIALLRLPTPALLNDRVSVIELASKSHRVDAVGALGIVSGWGHQSDKNGSVAEYLQFVQQKIISNFVCTLLYAFHVRSTHVCMSGKLGKSVCHGDSGGPLIVKDSNSTTGYRQVGVVSFVFVFGCEVGWPAVFTRVSSYSAYISEITGLHIK